MNLPKISFFNRKNLDWNFFSFWLGFLLVLVAILLASQIVKTKTSLPETLKKTLGFAELLPTPAPYPVNQNLYQLPEISASSVFALDMGSMAILAEKNANLKVFPASTTKIMTALLALDYYQTDQVLRVGKLKTEGNKIGLVEGEEITVDNLLYGLLLGSGNDAALVLTQNYPGGTPAFVEAMNEKARALKLDNTRFVNPTGLDEAGHFSTAKDLARLTILAVKNPIFSQIVSTDERKITDQSGQHVHWLKNTNELVGRLEGVKGVKTGWTQNAGECLITLVERNGEKIVIVVLGSRDRFGETEILIKWIFDNFVWRSFTLPTYR